MFVLLVETDHQNAEAMTRILIAEGHRVQWTTDPHQLAGQATLDRPDVLLAGSDALARAVLPIVHELPAWSTVHVMVVNGESDPVAATQTIEAGADVYMSRPFRLAEFVARLRAIERRRAQEQSAGNP